MKKLLFLLLFAGLAQACAEGPCDAYACDTNACDTNACHISLIAGPAELVAGVGYPVTVIGYFTGYAYHETIRTEQPAVLLATPLTLAMGTTLGAIGAALTTPLVLGQGLFDTLTLSATGYRPAHLFTGDAKGESIATILDSIFQDEEPEKEAEQPEQQAETTPGQEED